ncbi:MAG: hypothetical protein ABIT69_07515 [Sphingomicrobium sp.]
MRFVYGWWSFDDAAQALVRTVDGASLCFRGTDLTRPRNALSRWMRFRLTLPGVGTVDVPVERRDMPRHAGPWLAWLIEMGQARLNDGPHIVDNPHSGAVETLLLDAFACWPEVSDAGVKPWTVAMRGGRVDGASCPDRLRTVDGVTSRDERPRWPKRPFAAPIDPDWRFHPGTETPLDPLPDFAAMSSRAFRDWLAERMEQSPRLVSAAVTLFPLGNQGQLLRWVYVDEEFVTDRLISVDSLIAPHGNWVISDRRESRIGTRLMPSGRPLDFLTEFSRKVEPRRVTADGLWQEGSLSTVWQQRMAEAVNAAMFHWQPTLFATSDNAEPLDIVPPMSLRMHLHHAGGVLRLALHETRRPEPAANAFVPYDPAGAVTAGLGGRVEIDSRLAEVRDLDTGQRLSFSETLDGSGDSECEQRARFTYRDEDGEWPLIVHRPVRQDPLRIEEWTVDLRGESPDV